MFPIVINKLLGKSTSQLCIWSLDSLFGYCSLAFR